MPGSDFLLLFTMSRSWRIGITSNFAGLTTTASSDAAQMKLRWSLPPEPLAVALSVGLAVSESFEIDPVGHR